MIGDEINEIVVMISELILATSTKCANWWLEFGAMIHVCHDKNQLKKYEAIDENS